MARIDSLLSILDRQGANELRLGSDREPQMFADGAQKRLAMPKTSMETLRELLGELPPPDREKMLAAQGQVQFLHESQSLGPFRVSLTRRSPPGADLEIDALFVRGRGKAAPAPAPAAAAPFAPQPPTRVAPAKPVAETLPRSADPAPLPVAAPRSPSSSTTGEGPTPQLVELLARARAFRASDVHLLDGEGPVLRVDGKLRAAEPVPVDVLRLLGPALAEEARRRLAAGGSADLGVGLEGVGRVRINVYQAARGISAAIRLLPEGPPALGDLGLPVPIDDIVDLPHGLVLVCGATGSGKSSTLAALAQEALRRRPGMVITLEDPIEFDLGSRGARGIARQRQVGRDVSDFATGLRDALREDPDLLVIGEMRDPETISLALTAAETGHLVLASLHSRSAASAVERIVDAYPPARQQQIRIQLADALRVVLSQRLLPRLGGEGRALALEVLRGNAAVASAVREGKTGTLQSAIQSGKRDGMLALERCLADLVLGRRVSLEDARAAANDPAVLASYLAP
jgi:twitching motility protein PilT